MENYQVKLDVFEGPLDLLLYLIRKNDLDIYDIPIARITAEYLEFVEIIKILNLESVGDFLVMATTLMQIKTQMLLPTPENQDKTEEITDPRNELVTKLLAYQKNAQLLAEKAQQQNELYFRQEPVFTQEDYILNVSTFDLLSAFRTIFKRSDQEIREIIYETIPIEQRIREVLDLLNQREYLTFQDLFPPTGTKQFFIITFLAVLELVRLRQINAKQNNHFSEIRIYRYQPDQTNEVVPRNESLN